MAVDALPSSPCDFYRDTASPISSSKRAARVWVTSLCNLWDFHDRLSLNDAGRGPLFLSSRLAFHACARHCTPSSISRSVQEA